MILIFRKHSAQNNVQGSARIAWSGKRNCNDMMISLQEKTTQAIRLAKVVSAVCVRLLTCNLRNLSFVCLISNQPQRPDPAIIELDSG